MSEKAKFRPTERFSDLADARDCIASDLALVDREHIDRHSEHANCRSLLLGDNNVLADTRHSAWGLGRGHQ